MAHEPRPEGNLARDRLVLPFILPLLAAAATAALIVTIGNVLLFVRSLYPHDEALAARVPVAVALALALAVLAACAAVAATWGRRRS